jgi:hypothetical protein
MPLAENSGGRERDFAYRLMYAGVDNHYDYDG